MLPLSLVLTSGLCAPNAYADQVVYARHLSLTRDGKTLAFGWAGDIWTVSSAGGAARRLTVHPSDDSHPVFSPDGERIAFASSRHGANDVFVMTADGYDVTRLTFADRPETPSGWSPDGAYVYYSSRKNGEVDWLPRAYRVPAAGGQSLRAIECGAVDPRPSPDGKYLMLTRGASRWWRTGYRGSANWNVWLRENASGRMIQLTDFDGTDFAPSWTAESNVVYFLSDRVGVHNVWRKSVAGGDATQVTHAAGDRVRDFAVSADGGTLVYTQWDKLFVQAPPDAAPREIVVSAGGDSSAKPVDLKTLTSGADEVSASPDGKELALVERGEIFVIQTEKGRLTRRVTDSVFRDRQVSWSPDGKALYFISDRSGQEDIYRATSSEDPPKALSESLRFKVERITDNPAMEQWPQVSPDGKSLLFVRGLGDVIVRDLKSGDERTLLEQWNWPELAWSPDSKWIAYAVEDEEYNSDIWIVPADGSAAAVNISQHPDNDTNPAWSADGQVLAFSSQRQGFDSDLYLVFLSAQLNEKSSSDLDEYFKQAGERVKKRKPIKDAVASGAITLAGGAASGIEDKPKADVAGDAERPKKLEDQLRSVLKEFLKPPKGDGDEHEDKDAEEQAANYAWNLDTAYRRVRRVTSLPADQWTFALSPDGSTLAFPSRHEGSAKLYTIKWNGREQKSIVSSAVGALQFGFDGKRLYYLKGGVPASCTASGGDQKSHAFRAKMAIVRAEEAAQKFDDAARMLGMRFYHPTLKDLDWGALSKKYRELALQTHTDAEFTEIFNQLQGRLNGSHLGMSGPRRGGAESIGYLGCDFDPQYAGPGLKVTAVLKNSPADREESRIFVGDILRTVNGSSVGPDAAIEQALIDSAADPVIVSFVPSAQRPADDDKKEPAADGLRELVIRPISYRAFSRLRYQEWVDANERYVDEHSNGRLAYAHISGMGEPQFYTFERDLYAVAHGRDGLIVDVRNNGGGWTADWVMAVLNVRRHAYTIGRGGKRGYPQDRLIFYAWTRPATMMCNQFSYSNAEIVSHAFKNLGRGPLVGMTTFGAVISTGAYGLIDGSRIRMPFRGWYTLPQKQDMELHGAVPTVLVDRTPDDEINGRYPQLDAAIRATLAQIESAKSAGGAR